MKQKPKIVRFFARVGAPFGDDKATVYGKELVRLERGKKRALKTSEVVEAARRPKSPLHDAIFGDSNAEAADKWRLNCARNVINAIRVEWQMSKSETIKTHLWWHFDNEPSSARAEGEYRNMEYVLQDPDSRATMLENAMEEMLAFRKRWEVLTELSGVFREIDAAIQKIVGKIETETAKK